MVSKETGALLHPAVGSLPVRKGVNADEQEKIAADHIENPYLYCDFRTFLYLRSKSLLTAR